VALSPTGSLSAKGPVRALGREAGPHPRTAQRLHAGRAPSQQGTA